MSTESEREILQKFAKKFIKLARDQSINENFITLNGQSRSKSDKDISDKLQGISSKQHEGVKDIIIDSIDTALNNFLWLIEQEDDFDIVSCKDGGHLSLKDLSDGLSVDYWNFVDDYSEYECKNL